MSWDMAFFWNTYETRPLIWQGKATTTRGIATFYPTVDEKSEGMAIFSRIDFYQVTVLRDTESAIDVPLGALKAISADLKSVTVNAITGTSLAALAPTVLFVPDGTEVCLFLTGREM